MIRYSNNGIPLNNPLQSHYNTGTPPQVGSPFGLKVLYCHLLFLSTYVA